MIDGMSGAIRAGCGSSRRRAEHRAIRSPRACLRALCCAVRAIVGARRERVDEADRMIKEARTLSLGDSLLIHGVLHTDLAEALRLSGRPEDAREALLEAVRLFERKVAVPFLDRTRRALTALQPKGS